MKKPKIIAHRGLSRLFPENSLVAFAKAVELGADGVECDVRRTSDNHIVVIHDDHIDRTTTGEGMVCLMKLEEIRSFCLKGPSDLKSERQWDEQKVPTFDEFLDLMMGNDLEMRIEIKETGFEEKLVQNVIERQLQDRVLFTSFLPRVIRRIKDADFSVKSGIITERFAQVRYEDILPDISAVDFAFGPGLLRSVYDRARNDGLVLDLWTIDRVDVFNDALKWEPDCITSNAPDILLEAMNA